MTTHSSTGFGLSSGENLNDDLGPSSVVATMVIATLAGLALVARLVSRAIQRISFGASDVLAILGLLFSWVVSGLVVYGWHFLLSSIFHDKESSSEDSRREVGSRPAPYRGCYK